MKTAAVNLFSLLQTCNIRLQRQYTREYQNKGIYVISATVDDNVIRLKRVRKSGNGFKATNSDSILNQKKKTATTIRVQKELQTNRLPKNIYACRPVIALNKCRQYKNQSM